jgi:hypothetical protein
MAKGLWLLTLPFFLGCALFVTVRELVRHDS